MDFPEEKHRAIQERWRNTPEAERKAILAEMDRIFNQASRTLEKEKNPSAEENN